MCSITQVSEPQQPQVQRVVSGSSKEYRFDPNFCEEGVVVVKENGRVVQRLDVVFCQKYVLVE